MSILFLCKQSLSIQLTSFLVGLVVTAVASEFDGSQTNLLLCDFNRLANLGRSGTGSNEEKSGQKKNKPDYQK